MARRRLWRNDVVRSYWRTRHPLLRFLCRKEPCRQREELGSKRSVSFPIQIKSNQIKSLLLSHHHSTSALVSEILMSVLQTVQKNNRQFTYGQTVQKNNKQFTYGQTVQKNNKQFTYGQTVQKNNKQFTYGQTVQKNNKQFTYGQTVQKNNKQFTYGQTVQKNCTGAFTVLQTVQKKNNNNLHMDRQCKKKTTAIYIWTDSAKNNSNLHMDSTYLQTVQKTMCKIHIHILSTLSVL